MNWNYPPGMSRRELDIVEGVKVSGVCCLCGVLLEDAPCGVSECWGDAEPDHCEECCEFAEDDGAESVEDLDKPGSWRE